MIQPFVIIEGLTTTKYSTWFVSDSKEDLVDRKRYETIVEFGPWGKLISSECECNGFKFGKTCKHIKEIIKLLKEWGEIITIPDINIIDYDEKRTTSRGKKAN